MPTIVNPEPTHLRNAPSHDIELGRDSASIHSELPPYERIETPPPPYADIAKNAAYDALAAAPYGSGRVLKKAFTKPAPVAPESTKSARGKLASALTSVAVGSLVTAPFGAAGACLANVTGSWVMSLHHSHADYGFHGGAVQGNYAIAGAAAAVPVVVTLVAAKACLSEKAFNSVHAVHTVVSPFAYSAAEGAAAAAIGAARGFDMQTVGHSAIANVAGTGFLTALTVAALIF